ncbi:MAG: restriction endonuclease subunit S [Oligoflexia bacterium]|nr:restriction endonuclease subunit S [Oligoflexia bacterium]
MIKKLSEVTDIYLGQPIRDKIENTPSGDFFIVQMKDVTKDSGVKTEALYKINLKGRIGPRLVKKGDLLFVPRVFRGSLPYSVLVDADLPNLVAAPTFNILSVKKNLIRAEYLHWFINSEIHGGKFFKQNAMGSSVLNIPKNLLNEMEVVLPPLQQQDRFIKLIQAANLEKEIMEALVEKRRVLVDATLTKFSNQKENT